MSGVKVLKRGDNPEEGNPSVQDPEQKLFCAELSTGQQVCIRAVRASDIMWMETLDKGKGIGEVQKSLKLVAKLSTGTEHPISFTTLGNLNMPDLKIVTDLLSKASGTETETEEEEFDENF